MAERARAMVTMAAATLLAACAPSSGSGTGQSGHDGGPRIVSLNPCADAILAEIAPERLLAVSHYSHDPASASMDVREARRFPAISGSAEEIAALAPDVVVAGAFLNPATERALHAMHVDVVKLGSIASLADARAQVRDLAALAGTRERGEAMVGQIDRAVAAAAPEPGTPVIAALVWQSGGLVPGERTLVSDLLRHTGFSNFSAGQGLGQGAIVPLEEVLADPPEVILIAGESRMQSHPALDALAPDKQRALFPTQLGWCGGPTIPKAAARLAQIRKDTLR